MKQLLVRVRDWFASSFTGTWDEPSTAGSEGLFEKTNIPKVLYPVDCGNGKVILPHPYRPGPLVIHGGPYREKPPELLGVRLEMSAPADESMAVDFPIVDFGVPNFESLFEAVDQAFELVVTNREIYIGCTGGFGRTGLFATCLIAKVMHNCGFPFSHGKEATAYLRANYVPNAVETSAQQGMVDRYVDFLNAG